VYDTDLNKLLYFHNGWRHFSLWQADSGGNLYYNPGKVTIGAGSDTSAFDAVLNISGTAAGRAIHSYTITTDSNLVPAYAFEGYGIIELKGDSAEWRVDSAIVLESGKFFLNSNTLILYNGDTLALRAVNGKLIANSSQWGKVRWFIKENTGNYSLPFCNDSLNEVSIGFEVIDAGTGEDAYLEFSTFWTDATETPNNIPHPPDLIYFQEAAATIDSNWQKIADRYCLPPPSVPQGGFL